MNLHLGAELEAFVREKVASGGYRSASEVVRDALRAMRDRERERTLQREPLGRRSPPPERQQR